MPTASESDVVPAARPRVGERPAVLVVDDNAANLIAMEALLSSLEVDLIRASSGEEALKQLLARDFALVLMDIQMPGLDGFQTTAAIRQRDRSRHTPIIFLTAIFTDEASAHKAYALGAVDYLTKPFDETILKAKVAALTNHHRQLDVIERQAVALKIKQEEAEREHAARREAEAENRAKDDFLAMLSHELRAPLTAIVGRSGRLQERGDLPPEAAQDVDVIVRNAKAQAKLIDDLLDLSQMVVGKITIAAGVVDLATVTQSALATMAAHAVPNRIQLDLDVAPDTYAVAGDAKRLEQLICALLSNAIKFSDAGSVVRVELSRSGSGVQLRVKDTGVGIRADLLPHAFERFRQGDASWTRKHGGLGIGLAIAQHLAKLHGGTVEAFSGGEGMGAVFVLTLPPAAQPGDRASAPPRVASNGSASTSPRRIDGLRVLVVDDDADTRELLAMVIDDGGASVTTACSAAEALARLQNHGFDVLISDLGMPGEDGLALMRKVRTTEAGAPQVLKAVAVSGYGSDEDREQAARAGFDDHITKPVDGRTLLETLVRLTRRL